MTDLYIVPAQHGYDLDVVNGDLVLTSSKSRLQEVAQRVVYRLLTWLGESAYDRSAGIPYADGVFGKNPAEGVAFLLIQEIRQVDGVDSIEENPIFDLDPQSRRLSIRAKIRVGDEVGTISLQVAA